MFAGDLLINIITSTFVPTTLVTRRHTVGITYYVEQKWVL